jgi:CheY-like chemotaxis protein
MPHIVALVGDLMSLSRIREAARRVGLEVRTVRHGEDLRGAALDARLVLVDADETRWPWEQALASLRQEGPSPTPPVVAFASHVRADRVAAARAAGCDRVYARGAFVTELPRLLAASAAATPEEEAGP